MRRKGGAYVVDVVMKGSGKEEQIIIDPAAEESVCPSEWAGEFGTDKVQKGR